MITKKPKKSLHRFGEIGIMAMTTLAGTVQRLGFPSCLVNCARQQIYKNQAGGLF